MEVQGAASIVSVAPSLAAFTGCAVFVVRRSELEHLASGGFNGSMQPSDMPPPPNRSRSRCRFDSHFRSLWHYWQARNLRPNPPIPILKALTGEWLLLKCPNFPMLFLDGLRVLSSAQPFLLILLRALVDYRLPGSTLRVGS